MTDQESIAMFISITEETVAQADTVSRTLTTEPRVGTGGDDVSSAEGAVAEDYRMCPRAGSLARGDEVRS